MTVRFALSLLTIALAVAACGEQSARNHSGRADSSSASIDSAKGATSAASSDSTASDSTPLGFDPTRKYAVRSGRVVYYNSKSAGEDTLFFDDYGEREAFYSAITRTSMEAPAVKHVAIYNEGFFYQYDALLKTGKKFQHPNPEGPILGFIPDIFKATGERSTTFQLRRIKPRNFLGKPAAGYSYEYAALHNLWLWNGIPMRDEWTTHDTPPVTSFIEVRSVDIDIEIPRERFTPAKSITFLNDEPTEIGVDVNKGKISPHKIPSRNVPR